VKRFYREVSVRPAAGGHALLLDERPVRTPARAALVAPSAALAAAIAAEWESQSERVDPRSMPLTGLANAAIDRVALDPAAFAATLKPYGGSDLLCYRAPEPAPLVARQAAAWDEILTWARRRYDVDFEVVAGVTHRPQPAHTLAQLGRAVDALGAFELAGLSPLVTASGSLVIGLAVAERALDAAAAWAAASVDESWQAEKWGEDAEAAQALAARRADFGAGARFLELLRDD
jgi:chaperone required for assembly of F1-ATPase